MKSSILKQRKSGTDRELFSFSLSVATSAILFYVNMRTTEANSSMGWPTTLDEKLPFKEPLYALSLLLTVCRGFSIGWFVGNKKRGGGGG